MSYLTMKLLTILIILFCSKAYSQNFITGNWEIKTSSYNLHPFEKDTLILVKPDTIKNEITKEVSIITGKRNINLLSFSNSFDAEYIPNFHQSIDTGFVQDYFSENYADTLIKQFSSLAIIQNKPDIEFIFYNNLNIIDHYPTEKKTLKKCISNGKKHIKFNFKVEKLSNGNLLLIKNLP